MASRIVRGMLLVAAAVSLVGCAAKPMGGPPETVAKAVASIVATIPAPSLPYSEYRLPGSWRVRAYTGREALVTRADRARGTDDLFLLDLADGRVRSLVTTPVAAARKLVFAGCTLSDEVVAWEEVSRQDADFPEQTVWRLYACRYDPSRGLIGSPVLLDGADGDARSRPLFGVDGRAIVWLSNTRHRTGRWSGSVKRFDMDGAARTAILDAATPFDTLSLSEHRVLLTRETTTGGEELLSLSLEDRRSIVTPLHDAGNPSHFPATHDGVVAWSVFKDDKPWPDLFIGDAKRRTLLARDALDAVFAGDYLFYESNEASDSPRDKSHYGSIWGIRQGSERKFRLLLTDVSTEGWWQTAMAQGYLEDVFVVANDLCPWNEGKDLSTLVRVYRLRS